MSSQPARPSVSVIVPTYNCGHFIAEAIDSIVGQIQVPDQIIVVDDGSTDDTERVVRRFSDPRIEYIKQKNTGVSTARNTGLSAARGEFVTFLDADDRWRPMFVKRMHDILVSDPTVVCSFGNFVRFEHETGQQLRDQFHYYPELRRGSYVRIPQDQAFSVLMACGEIPAYTQVMMFRRALIEPIRFDTSLALCEDTHFALRTYLQGAVAYTDEVLADIRRHARNATRHYHEMATHKLTSLKALGRYVTGSANIAAYRDRLVKAHIDASLHQARSGRVRAGLRDYLHGLSVPGAPMRKLKGLVRMALVLPWGLAQPL